MPARKPSTDIVTIDGPMQSQQVIDYLWEPDRFHFTPFEDDPEAIQRRIVEQDLAASSADDLFGVTELLHAKDLVGKPFQLNDVEWRPSSIDGGQGLPFYGIFSVVLATGEITAFSCGAAGVVRKAAIAKARGWLPVWVKIVERDKTASGYVPLDLVGVKAPVAASGSDPAF